MASPFQFAHELAFEPGRVTEILRAVPAKAGVFALYAADPSAQPYLTRAADIRRRMHRLLYPPAPAADGQPAQSKRLNLSARVTRIGYTVAGSEFEAYMTLYSAAIAIYGPEQARRRLRLYAPFCARLSLDNHFPRLYSTNRFGRRNLAELYGPFQSHLAADRYVDGVLDLFKLRRCWEELQPYPEHPGCIYGEIDRCLKPCKQEVDAASYGDEAGRVKAFLDSGGESMLETIECEREQASTELDFERAAALHERHSKVKAVTMLAAELVRPLPMLRAVIIQGAAEDTQGEEGRRLHESQDAAVYLLRGGCIGGPERLSTLGVRAVKEQTSVGSSLFAQPLMLQAIPLAAAPADRSSSSTPTLSSSSTLLNAGEATGPALPLRAGLADYAVEDHAATAVTLNPEARAAAVLASLELRAESMGSPDQATLSDHLSLLRRWYYRPEKQRAGEILFPNPDGSWPVRRILNAAARVVLGTPAAVAETQRDAASTVRAELKQKLLHGGREGVERLVPDLAAATLPEAPAEVAGYRSRRRASKTNALGSKAETPG